jgi:hypothetical protein
MTALWGLSNGHFDEGQKNKTFNPQNSTALLLTRISTFSDKSSFISMKHTSHKIALNNFYLFLMCLYCNFLINIFARLKKRIKAKSLHILL